MNELLTFLADGLNRTLVPMTIAVALLWILELSVVRLTPKHRCWLWRLLFLKCIVVFFLPVGLPMPRVLGQTLEGDSSKSATESLVVAVQPPHGLPPSQPLAAPHLRAHDPDTRSRAANLSIDGPTWLLLLWSLGVSVNVALFVHCHGVLGTRLRRGDVPALPNTLRNLYADVARQMQVDRLPRLRLNDRFTSPALVYRGHAQIVLPADFQSQHGKDACRVAMAHELAHYRRHDLYWNALVSVVSVGLFFFPPLWLARRRYRLAMESACDWDAIHCGRLGSAMYARLLVALTQPSLRRSTSLGVVSMSGSESFRSLSERLNVMKRFHLLSRSALVIRTLVTLLMLCVLVPWTQAQDRYTVDKPPVSPSSKKAQSSSASVSSSSSSVSGPNGQVLSHSQMSANASGNALSSGSASARAILQGPRKRNESSSSAAGNAQGNPAKPLLPGANSSSSSSVTRNGIQLTRLMQANGEETVTKLDVIDKKKEFSVRESNQGPIEVRVRDHRKDDGEHINEKVYTAATREELKRAEPELVRRIQRYEKLAGNVQATVDADRAFSRASSDGLAPLPGPGARNAQQMMRDQLQQMLDQNADNPQLQGMLRKMIQDVENQSP